MKRLSDYKGAEALDLWASIMPNLVDIMSDTELQNIDKKATLFDIASHVFSRHGNAVAEILTTIDPTPINGLNVITRLVGVIQEVMTDEDMRAFFGLQSLNLVSDSFGSAMENTEDKEA